LKKPEKEDISNSDLEHTGNFSRSNDNCLQQLIPIGDQQTHQSFAHLKNCGISEVSYVENTTTIVEEVEITKSLT
jgi:hypothetical protein|tara:strand:- start:387 stop:611 length:225 start_codon:yes stop_codon:yes gene_type:complete